VKAQREKEVKSGQIKKLYRKFGHRKRNFRKKGKSAGWFRTLDDGGGQRGGVGQVQAFRKKKGEKKNRQIEAGDQDRQKERP